jgi:VanZ family protein
VGIGKTHLFNSLTAQQLNSLTLLLMTMAFALSDEIHQLFVPGRAFQVIDLIIDFLGILFGVFLYTKLKIEPQR